MVESYTDDLRGNRLSRQLDGGSVEPRSYGLRDRIAMVGSTVYTVDIDGQLTGRGSDDFAYGPRGELPQATVGSEVVDYGVDAVGRRVSRHDTGGDLEILYGMPGAWWLRWPCASPTAGCRPTPTTRAAQPCAWIAA